MSGYATLCYAMLCCLLVLLAESNPLAALTHRLKQSLVAFRAQEPGRCSHACHMHTHTHTHTHTLVVFDTAQMGAIVDTALHSTAQLLATQHLRAVTLCCSRCSDLYSPPRPETASLPLYNVLCRQRGRPDRGRQRAVHRLHPR